MVTYASVKNKCELFNSEQKCSKILREPHLVYANKYCPYKRSTFTQNVTKIT